MSETQAPRAFGRRISAPRTIAPAPPSDVAQAEILFAPDLDQELEDWKRSRRWQPPWRQIALMASLCFGIASLILPDSVNDTVQWGLYGLTALSLIAGLRRKA